MKFLKLTAVLIFLLAIMSCQTKNTTSETVKTSEGKMIEKGFKKATVIYSNQAGDCEYTFAVEGETNLFDPVNLEDKFQKSQQKIWVKYTPLRMPNRCEKASPVEVTEIQPRK